VQAGAEAVGEVIRATGATSHALKLGRSIEGSQAGVTRMGAVALVFFRILCSERRRFYGGEMSGGGHPACESFNVSFLPALSSLNLDSTRNALQIV
jgi:hypothetical protein